MRSAIRSVVSEVAPLVSSRYVGDGDASRSILVSVDVEVGDTITIYYYHKTNAFNQSLIGGSLNNSGVFINASSELSIVDSFVDVTMDGVSVSDGDAVPAEQWIVFEFTVVGNAQTITRLGATNADAAKIQGYIANVFFKLNNKLPKGTYLLGDGTAYTQVNIPVEAGDEIEFDYLHTAKAGTQTLMSTNQSLFPIKVSSSNIFEWDVIDFSSVNIASGVTLEAGQNYLVEAVAGRSYTVTYLSSDSLGGRVPEGTIANFKVTKLDGSTYEYLTKNSIVDNGDGTAIAPQTGSVAEYGDNLLDQSDSVFGDGWSSDGNGLFSCDGTQAVNTNLVVYLVEPLNGEQPIYYECSVISRIAGSIATRVGSLTVSSYSDNTGDRSFYYLAPNSTPHVGFRANSDFIGQVEVKAVYPTTNGLIPVFNPTDNLITYASNVVDYPIDESSGVDVLAYDENGARYPTYDGNWTPDADHVFIQNKQTPFLEDEAMKEPITNTISLADAEVVTYGVGGNADNNNEILQSFNHHQFDVSSGSLQVQYTPVKSSAVIEGATITSSTDGKILDLTGVQLFTLTATGATEVTITSY